MSQTEFLSIVRARTVQTDTKKQTDATKRITSRICAW